MRGERTILRTLAALILVGMLVACSKPPAPAEAPAPTGIDAIPAPNPALYPSLSNLKDWKNPYLVVREDGIGLVDLNTRDIRLLQPEEVVPVLNALPDTAWPYGRVVLVGEAAPQVPSQQAKDAVHKNRDLLTAALTEKKILIHNTP